MRRKDEMTLLGNVIVMIFFVQHIWEYPQVIYRYKNKLRKKYLIFSLKIIQRKLNFFFISRIEKVWRFKLKNLR